MSARVAVDLDGEVVDAAHNSIYRFDDEMLVNTHLYGTPAAYAPVLHLRRLGGGDLFDSYVASFNRVLGVKRAVWPEH